MGITCLNTISYSCDPPELNNSQKKKQSYINIYIHMSMSISLQLLMLKIYLSWNFYMKTTWQLF